MLEEDSNRIIQDLIVKNENLRSHVEDLELFIMMMADLHDFTQYDGFAESMKNLLDFGDNL